MAEDQQTGKPKPGPFRSPEEPGESGPRPKDLHIQSSLDMEVFRFLGLAGLALGLAAWLLGAFGFRDYVLGVPIGLFMLWLIYLVVRRALVLTRDMADRPGVGDGILETVGVNFRPLGVRGTHLGMVVIDGVDYGLALKTVRKLQPDAHVQVWYYESSRHIIRIEESPDGGPPSDWVSDEAIRATGVLREGRGDR